MNTFISVFTFFYSLYGIGHLYAFLKVKYTFHPGMAESVLLGLFLLFMMFSPSLVRICSLRMSEGKSRTIAYISYAWMALLLFFFTSGLPIDLYNIGIHITGNIINSSFDNLAVPVLHAFYIPLLLAVPLSVYSFYEAGNLKTRKITIKTSKLPENTGRLTIAHISDLHLGIMVRDVIVNKISRELKKADPDLIVSTGDLIEEEVHHVAHLSEPLRQLEARLGKYAVTGNHDFFTNIDQSVQFMKDSGFIPLRGQGVTIQNIINIAGIDDPISMNGRHTGDRPSERDILSGLPSNLFTLLLKHRPDIDKNSLGLFDLQLSGHTHGGQLMQLRVILKLLIKHGSGYKALSNGSALYVSRGAGTACSPIRFLTPPEITIIEIEREQ